MNETRKKWEAANRDKVLLYKKRAYTKRKKLKEPGNCATCGVKLDSAKKKRCPDCKKLEQKRVYAAWLEANREARAAKRAQWFQANKKKILKKQKAYRESLR